MRILLDEESNRSRDELRDCDKIILLKNALQLQLLLSVNLILTSNYHVTCIPATSYCA